MKKKKEDNLLDKKKGKQNKKLSKKALQEIARPFAHKAILKAADLLENGDNDNVRLGAAKLLLAKVLPDMKATDITTDGDRIEINVIRSVNKRSLEGS